MTIGARNDGAQPLVASLMDEFRIWNIARSTCLLRRDARVQVPPATLGLVVYYDFNQGVPGADNTGLTTLPDLSGGDDNGTLVNFALMGGSSNWLNSDLLTTTGFPAVRVNRSNLVTSEYGTSDSFDVVLGYAPTQNVVLNVSTDNNAEALVLPVTLTFTPGDWNVPQPVVVSGLDDGVGDGDSVYHVIVATDPSSDVDYACEQPLQIDATNLSDIAFQDGFE